MLYVLKRSKLPNLLQRLGDFSWELRLPVGTYSEFRSQSGVIYLQIHGGVLCDCSETSPDEIKKLSEGDLVFVSRDKPVFIETNEKEPFQVVVANITNSGEILLTLKEGHF